MRAIDGDALRDRLQNLGYDDWNQGTTTTWAEAFNECADMVDEQPTIEPRKKGHKINQHQYPAKWICSECGAKHFNFSDNFCSECGANVEDNS